MKKLKYLPLLFVIAFIAYSFGFSISEIMFTDVTIQQIQYKSPDSLAVGRDKSDMLGDSVQFVARVVAPPRVSPANNDLRIMLRGSCSPQPAT